MSSVVSVAGLRKRAAVLIAPVLAALFASGCFSRRPPSFEEILVLKVGPVSWTAADLEQEITASLKGRPIFPVDEDLIKKKALGELVFKSLLKIWAERQALSNPPPAASSRILHNKLQERLQKKAAGTPLKESGLRDFYRRHKKKFCRPARRFLEHILTERENQARILHRRLLRGESFEETAAAHSLAPSPIGYIEKGALKTFDKAFDLAGAFSPPLKSRYGYHIFRPGPLKPPACMSFKEAKERIAKHARAKRAAELFQKWIQTELRGSPVFLNEELLNSLHISYKRRLF